MILAAALMLFLVGLMHSLLGGRWLINPILAKEDLPIILGSLQNSKMTLLIGWHVLTLFWWGQAVVLIVMYLDVALAGQAVLLTLGVVSAITGGLAIVLSRGRHLSWVFFFPISVLTLGAAIFSTP